MRFRAAALLAFLAGLLAGTASGQDRAGDFEFYVLALSWSPTYCETRRRSPDPAQCGDQAVPGFIVHGLWPQHERGYPESCATEQPLRVPSSLLSAMADIMPRSLVGYQWRKHGTCTGLTQDNYFALIRAARDRVAVPEPYDAPEMDQQVGARTVEQAFIAANPGLSESGMAVACQDGRLAEVRICLTRSLDFRRCPEVDARGCGAGRILMPSAG